MEDKQQEAIHRLIEDISAQLSRLQLMVHDYVGTPDAQADAREKAYEVGSVGADRKGRVVEGVFDGQNMVGPDGKTYTVPANYASKSKLCEGDIMKLTISDDGSFIYKQIGPVERVRMIGNLVLDEQGMYRAITEKNGRSYRLLTASVTYYRGEPGDQVIMLVPKDMSSRWAAVENIVPSDDDQALEEGLLDLGDEFELVDGSDMLLEDGDNALLEDGDEGLLEDGAEVMLEDAVDEPEDNQEPVEPEENEEEDDDSEQLERHILI